ncbi:hypothetical protein JTE90_010550 [Oedothorax gibbosus]|uniref:Uncharacterized protein n=1 Tax=Oedothorax gibbosus TaxID=931172 RepID=A0AAV6U3R6_9ARAC|nr:hypothetical protein JTE90_010550 [Oedothorax gibbosus]
MPIKPERYLLTASFELLSSNKVSQVLPFATLKKNPKKMKCSIIALFCVVMVLGLAMNHSMAAPHHGGGGGMLGGGGGKHGQRSDVIEILAAGLIAKLLSEMNG